jgi:hypothetical protein
MSRVEDTYNTLEEKGFSRERIAIGYLDEASPQTTANTVRFWHVGCGDIVKNTSKYHWILCSIWKKLNRFSPKLKERVNC